MQKLDTRGFRGRLERIVESLRVSIRLRKWRARVRLLLPLAPGVTVVIVNWNSLDMLRTAVDAVRRFSPAGTRLLIVDNASEDGSWAYLRTVPGIEVVRLPRNVGHGAALDIGVLASRTRWVVTLDVDAFPITDEWIAKLIEPLERGYRVSGAEGGWELDRRSLQIDPANPPRKERKFVHPCCMAISLRRFVERNHTFRPLSSERLPDGRRPDVGELISSRELEGLFFLGVSSVRGPGALGTVFDQAVYHNFYGTRHLKESPTDSNPTLIEGLSRGDALLAWEEAKARFLTR